MPPSPDILTKVCADMLGVGLPNLKLYNELFFLRKIWEGGRSMFFKIGPIGGEIVALRNFTRNLHIFVDIFEDRIENQTKKLGKTVLIV